MFLGILDIIKNWFVFAYNTFDGFIVVGNASLLDFLIVFFVASVFLPLFASQFGGRAISTGSSSAINRMRERNNQKNSHTREK